MFSCLIAFIVPTNRPASHGIYRPGSNLNSLNPLCLFVKVFKTFINSLSNSVKSNLSSPWYGTPNPPPKSIILILLNSEWLLIMFKSCFIPFM